MRQPSRFARGHRQADLAKDEFEVVPHGPLHGRRRRPQHVRRVERRHQPHAPPARPLAADLAHGQLVVAEHVLGRGQAQRDDHLGPDRFQLPHEVRHARRRLVRGRHAVVRRAALAHVADVHLLPGQPHAGDHLVQQLPGPADERPAGQVLVLARPLADEEDGRLGVALAEDGLRPRRAQPALGAALDLVLVQQLQRQPPLLDRERTCRRASRPAGRRRRTGPALRQSRAAASAGRRPPAAGRGSPPAAGASSDGASVNCRPRAASLRSDIRTRCLARASMAGRSYATFP